MSDKFERGMNEIELLENVLEEATTDEERQEISNAMRDIERDLRDMYRREEILDDEMY